MEWKILLDKRAEDGDSAELRGTHIEYFYSSRDSTEIMVSCQCLIGESHLFLGSAQRSRALR